MSFQDQATAGLTEGVPNSSEEPIDQARKPNVPPCKPIFYHNLREMPTESAYRVVKKALQGWMGLAVVVVFNFVAMTALQYSPYTNMMMMLVDAGYATDWIVSLLLPVLLPAAVFGVYMCLYTAARKKSSLYYCCFFPMLALVLLVLVLEGIGAPNSGGGGLMKLIVIGGDAGRSIVSKVLIAVSMVCWFVGVGYVVWLGFLVRREYSGAGGLAAAGKEATRAGAQVAYDNREVIKETAWEHREQIKQVAVDNKDLIIQAAKDNKDLVVQVAREDPDFAWQAAMATAQAASSPSATTTTPSAHASQFQSSNPRPPAAAAKPANSTDDVIDWSKF